MKFSPDDLFLLIMSTALEVNAQGKWLFALDYNQWISSLSLRIFPLGTDFQEPQPATATAHARTQPSELWSEDDVCKEMTSMLRLLQSYLHQEAAA